MDIKQRIKEEKKQELIKLVKEKLNNERSIDYMTAFITKFAEMYNCETEE